MVECAFHSSGGGDGGSRIGITRIRFEFFVFDTHEIVLAAQKVALVIRLSFIACFFFRFSNFINIIAASKLHGRAKIECKINNENEENQKTKSKIATKKIRFVIGQMGSDKCVGIRNVAINIHIK